MKEPVFSGLPDQASPLRVGEGREIHGEEFERLGGCKLVVGVFLMSDRLFIAVAEIEVGLGLRLEGSIESSSASSSNSSSSDSSAGEVLEDRLAQKLLLEGLRLPSLFGDAGEDLANGFGKPGPERGVGARGAKSAVDERPRAAIR